MKIERNKLVLPLIAPAIIQPGATGGDLRARQPTQTPTVAQQHADGVERISAAELRAVLARGEAIVVDVRGEDSFARGHIKGAKHIQLNEIAARAGELPRDKTIITYCS